MRTCFEEALALQNEGYSIIPVDGVSKKPLIPWEEYQRRIPTEEEVNGWWKRWPNADLALVTGAVSGLIVVDIEAAGDLTLFDLDEGNTPSSRTGGGGRHFFYQYQPCKNAVRFAPFYDFRGDGGYVLLPPSKHKSGKTYEWVDPLGGLPPAPLPSAIRELLGEKHKPDITALLAGFINEGSRNSSATSIAGSLLSRFAPTEWDTRAYPLFVSWNEVHNKPPLDRIELRSIWESIIKAELGKRKMADRGIPVFGDGEFRPTVLAEGAKLTVTIPTNDGVASFVFEDTEQSGGHEIETVMTVRFLVPGSSSVPLTSRLNVISPSAKSAITTQLRDSFGKNVKWSLLLATACQALIEYMQNTDRSIDLSETPEAINQTLFHPFLLKNKANLLFGDGGTGKTFVCLRLAITLAMDGEMFGFRPSEPCKTLFVDYEDTAETASERISMICRGLGVDPAPIKESIRYFNPEGIALPFIVPALKKIIQEHQIGLILVDSVVSACGGKPEDGTAPANYFGALKKLGITSLSIAHVSKGQTKEDEQGYAFGSIFWHNLARNTWNVRGEEEMPADEITSLVGDRAKQLGFFHRKNNNGPRHRPIPCRIVYGDRTVKFEEGDVGFWETHLPIPDRIVRILQASPLGMNREMLREALGKPNENSLKYGIRMVMKSGLITQPEGQNGFYFIKRRN
jgi:hypothetical protein